MQNKHAQCPLAKTQLYLHSSGRVHPCGFLQGHRSIGNIKEQGVLEVWNSVEAKQFRQEHYEGRCLECSKMQSKYNCHLLHPNISAEEEMLKRLDIMIDSFCNLACEMCTNRSEINQGFVQDKFWEELENNVLQDIEEIELVGGEPFIAKDSYRLIDLVKRVKPSIRWCFTTNGHFDFDKLLKHRLGGINIYSFAVSIDSFDKENFARIRINGDLEKATSTLLKLKKTKEEQGLDFYLSCNFLVQQSNYHELEQAFLFSEETGIPIYFILLREPEVYSILSFDSDKVVSIVDSYLHLARKYNSIKLLNMAIKITKELDKRSAVSLIDNIVASKKILGVR